jgi:hypothetical protein
MYRQLFNYKRTGACKANLKNHCFVGNGYVILAADIKSMSAQLRLRAHTLNLTKIMQRSLRDLSADRRMIFEYCVYTPRI